MDIDYGHYQPEGSRSIEPALLLHTGALACLGCSCRRSTTSTLPLHRDRRMKEQPKVYVIRAGKNGEDEEYALENGVAIIGFREIPSLEGLKDYEAIAKLVANSLPGAKPRAVGNFAGQLWAFAIAAREGDIVVLPRTRVRQLVGTWRAVAGGEVQRFQQVACAGSAFWSKTPRYMDRTDAALFVVRMRVFSRTCTCASRGRNAPTGRS